ncbi:MAG: phosphatidylglycerophosphatase A [Acidobacteria bacterium]|nr:MAG: phosphatidylglycerophosphatase A [Acidobacteriota bacterium]
MAPKNSASETPDRRTGVPLAPSGDASHWATLVATFFGIGRMRPGPGTWASAATVLLWWLLTRGLSPQWQPVMACLLAGLAVTVGIPAATRVSRAVALKDPQFVVIDEVAGQLITFVAVPATWKSLLLGFILFRGFDIVKPPPLRRLEHFREGVGIVLDDVGAGLYALGCMQIVLHFGLLK